MNINKKEEIAKLKCEVNDWKQRFNSSEKRYSALVEKALVNIGELAKSLEHTELALEIACTEIPRDCKFKCSEQIKCGSKECINKRVKRFKNRAKRQLLMEAECKANRRRELNEKQEKDSISY